MGSMLLIRLTSNYRGLGFDKMTMVLQAVRAQLLTPRGVDVWVTACLATRAPGRKGSALATERRTRRRR